MRLSHGKRLDPKADIVFKKIFGQNEDLVKSFLNGLMPFKEGELIETIDYMPSEQIPRTPLKKYSIVDVRCTDQKGRQFVVEMQMGWSDSFKKRLQFGVAKAYVGKLDAGQDYDLLRPVYGLALIGDIFNPQTEEWYHHYQILNIKDNQDQIKGIEMIFVELPKFEPKTLWERKLGILWLRFLNEISLVDEIPMELQEVPEISKAIRLTEESGYTPEELAAYDGYWDQIRIDKTIKSDARKKGRKEGFAEGLSKGIAKGKEEGLAEGLERGKLENTRQTVMNLLDMKTDDAMILKITGITQADLEGIKKTL